MIPSTSKHNIFLVRQSSLSAYFINVYSDLEAHALYNHQFLIYFSLIILGMSLNILTISRIFSLYLIDVRMYNMKIRDEIKVERPQGAA